MARKSTWVGVSVLLAFAQSATSASYELKVENPQTYASELFGTGGGELEINYENAAGTPKLTLTLNLSGPEMQMVKDEDYANVTISLANAKFAKNVPIGNFSATVMTGGLSPTAQTNVEVTAAQVNDEGKSGDSSVTVHIAASGTGWSSAVAGTINLTFMLPPLMDLDKDKPVTGSAEVDSPSTSGLLASTTAMLGNFVDDDGVISPRTSMSALVKFKNALTFEKRPGTDSEIDLLGGRTGLLPEDTPVGVLARVKAGVKYPNNSPLQLDGKPYSIEKREDGASTVKVTVSGDFRQGDMVFLDMNGDRVSDGGESLSLLDGVMSGGFQLVDVTDDPDSEERGPDQGVRTVSLIYKPNGKSALRPSQFRTVFALDFDLDTSDTVTLDRVVYTTTYSGIESTQQAYAIAPIASTDLANMRVRCEVATECTVYLECDDQGGASWFAKFPHPIRGRSTIVMQQDAIAEMLDVAGGEWEGRLSCSIHSTRRASEQVLTRSAGTLANNTYVDND